MFPVTEHNDIILNNYYTCIREFNRSLGSCGNSINITSYNN